MATNNNPDLVYLKSRDDLLQYEDTRLNSLLTSVANFYTTRNDQSIWGNFLRALAIELAKTDYSYSYDLVNKDPQFLTPSDIRRRWAAPLYISANWPSPQQLDLQYKTMLVQLLSAYRMGTTVAAIEAVIFAYTGIHITVVEFYKLIGNGIYDQSDRNAIGVSVQVGGAGSNPLTTITSLVQLQTIVQSLYNAVALAKPAHVGLEFTTIFGEGEDLDCLISPQFVTQQQYIQLDSVEQTYFTATAYVLSNAVIFWEPSTVTSNPFAPDTVLRDSNGNLQWTQAGGKPGLLVPVWNLTSSGTTTDNQITWANISPQPTNMSLANNVLTVTVPNIFTAGQKATLVNLSAGENFSFLNSTPSAQIILTVLSANATSFTAAYTHANVLSTPQTQGTAAFVPASQISLSAYPSLNTTYQSLYELQYTNTCSPLTSLQDWFHPGINDTLRIFVKQVEAEPQGPMLIQAPVLDPKNPKTTIAAYGKLLCPQLTPAQWATLPNIFVNISNGMSDGTNATYSYVPTTQFLHEGELLTITGFASTALNVTGRIKDVVNLAATISSTSVQSNAVTINAPNIFLPGMLVTFSGLTAAGSFLNGQSLVIQTANVSSFTVPFAHANYSTIPDTGSGEVSTFQIPNDSVVAFQAPSVGTNAGLVTPTLQSAYYLSSGNYVLGQPPIALSGAGIGSSWVPGANVFQGQSIVDSNGDTQLALNSGVSGATKPSWNETLNATTNDNGVQWRNVGRDTFSAPNTWVGILNMNYEFAQDSPATKCTLGFTGEVGNVDPNHQYGLVAPRLNQVWEISGGDESFIFGLY